MKNKIKNISIYSLILSMFLGVGQNIVYAKEAENDDYLNDNSEIAASEDSQEIEKIDDESQLEENDSKEEKQKQEQDKEEEQEDPVLEKVKKESLEEKLNEKDEKTDKSKDLLKERIDTSIEFVFTDDSEGNKILKEINNVDGGKISILEIPDTYEGKNVVGINPSALSGITEIETLIVPSITIDDSMFYEKKIKHLTVYKSKHSLGKINNSAFRNNPLDSIDISGITHIEENAFWFSDADFTGAEDNVINSLVIDNSLNGFGNGNIFPKNVIKNLEIPSITIRGGIFNDKGIVNLKIRSKEVENAKLEENSFENNPFKSIDISGIKYVNKHAFWFSDTYHKGTTENVIDILKFDGSLKELSSEEVFRDNLIKNLELPAIIFSWGMFNNKGIEHLTINKSLYESGILEDLAFYTNPLKTVDISGVKKIEENAFWFNDNSGQENIIESLKIDGELQEFGSGNIFPDNIIKNLEIPSVTTRWGIFNNKGIENLLITKSPYDISDKIGIIGDQSFRGNNLKKVKLSGVSSIGDYAFFENEISELDFSDSEDLKIIKKGAFAQNKANLNLVLPSNLEVIEIDAFASANVVGSLEIPKGMIEIGKSAFLNNQIDELNLTNANKLEKIGEHAFNGNNIKGSLFIPKSLKRIERYAFFRSGLEGKLILDGDISVIGRQAFAENNLTQVDIKDAKNLETIEYGAFHLNKIKGEIVFPESIKKIDQHAFFKNQIDTLNLSNANNLSEIGLYGFRANAIETIKWPSKSNVTTGTRLTLGKASLADNLLRAVSVPESVIELKENAFELNRLFQIQLKGTDTKIGPRAFGKQRSLWINSIDVASDNISVGSTDSILAGGGSQKIYFDEKALNSKKQDNAYLGNSIEGVAENHHVQYVEIGKNVGQNYTKIGLENDLKNLNKVIFYDGDTDISGLRLPSNVDIVGFRSMGSNVKPFAKTSVESDKNRLVLGSDDNTVNLVFKYTVDERQRTENPKAPEEAKNIRLVDRPISLTVKIDKIDNAEMQFKGVKLGDKLISAIQLTDKGSYYELILPTGNYLGEDNTVTIEMDVVVDTESYVLNHKPVNGYFKIDITPTIIASDDKGNIDEITGENEEVLITSSGVVFPPIGVKEYRETIFDANGGKYKDDLDTFTINSEREKIIEKENVEIPTRDNYTFVEWNTKADQSGEKITYPYKVLKNETYYAIWKENKVEVSEGSVIVKYIDKEGRDLVDPITLTGNVGDDYKTEAKEISGYTLVKTPENAIGVFSDTETIVTYVYNVKDNTPHTGITQSTGLQMIVLTCSLLTAYYLMKKKQARRS